MMGDEERDVWIVKWAVLYQEACGPGYVLMWI